MRKIEELSDSFITDDDTYFKDFMYATSSMTKTLSNGSTYDLEYYLNTESKETESLLVGSAFHCYILEPDEFNKRYVYAPKIDKRTKIGKQMYAEYLETIGDRKPIPEHYESIFSIIEQRLIENKNSKKLLKECTDYENLYFWKDLKTGLKCKGKVDGVGKDYIIDLKTTSKGVDVNSFKEFLKSWNLAHQAAFYCNGTQINTFYFIMCQLKAPFNVAVYKISDKVMKEGQKSVEYTLNLYKDFMENEQMSHINQGKIIEV